MSFVDPLLEPLADLPWYIQWLTTIAISMLPIIELRGALPAALNVFDLDWGVAMVLAIFGNMLPIPFIMIFFEKVEKFLRRFKIFDKFFNRLFESTRKKGERKVQVWGDIGLIFFVAVPLPVTGAWTGTLAAYLLKLNRVKAFLSIFVGVVIAGFIMTVVSFTRSYFWAAVIMLGLGVALFGIWKIEDIVMGRNTSDESSHEV